MSASEPGPLHRLRPDGSPLSLADLASAYAYPTDAPGGWWLRANMVSTVDGAAAADDGLSLGISSPRDRHVLGLLRALCEVVLVGSSTAVSEGYAPERPRPAFAELRAGLGLGVAPRIAVASTRLDLDLDAALFRVSDPAARTILLTTAAAGADRLRAAREVAEVLVVGETRVDPSAAVAALVALGHRRLLSEGGPRMLAEIVAGGLLDELCLTVSGRLLAGSGFRILGGPALVPPAGMTLGHVLADEHDLYLRYLRTPGRTSARS